MDQKAKTTLPLAIIVNKMDNAFDGIGHKNSTVLPESKNNMETYAQELFIAYRLVRKAEARKKMATKRCVEVGMIPDTSRTPLPPGTAKTLFQGETVMITITVGQGGEMIDPQGLIADLRAAGVSHEVLEKCINKNKRERRGQHMMHPMLVGSGEETED